MTALVVVEAMAIVLLGLLVVGLLRSHAEILRQLHALGAGREESTTTPGAMDVVLGPTARGRAHDVVGRTPAGEEAAVGVVGTTHDTLLAFLSSGCLTCGGFWRALGDTRNLGLPPRTRVLVVAKGQGEESESALLELAPPGVTVVMSTQAWLDYEVPGSPYFVHVDGPKGKVVGEGTAVTWEQVMTLVGRATSDRLWQRDHGVEQQVAAEREARIDEELLAAGIHPGDPRLYPPPPPVSGEEE